MIQVQIISYPVDKMQFLLVFTCQTQTKTRSVILVIYFGGFVFDYVEYSPIYVQSMLDILVYRSSILIKSFSPNMKPMPRWVR